MKVAALCAGYGGLEMGLEHAGIDVDLRWYCEIDPHASKVLAHHHPGRADDRRRVRPMTSSPRAEVPVPDNPVLSGATTATAQQLLAHSVFPPIGRTRPASFGARVAGRIDGDGLWALIGFIVGIAMWGYGPTWFAIVCTAAVGGHVGYRWIQRFGPQT